MVNFCCQLCLTFFASSIISMIKHLLLVHKNDPNVHIICEVPGCQRTFKSVSRVYIFISAAFSIYCIKNSFFTLFILCAVILFSLQVYTYKNHFYLKHKDTGHVNPSEIDVTPMETTDHCEINAAQPLPCDPDNRRSNALYILRVKEENLLTQKCVDDIVLSSTELIRNTVETIGNGVRECLSNAGIQFDTVPGLQELFSPINPVSNPFEHVSTKYKQVSFFKEEFGLIVSIFIYIWVCIILYLGLYICGH